MCRYRFQNDKDISHQQQESESLEIVSFSEVIKERKARLVQLSEK